MNYFIATFTWKRVWLTLFNLFEAQIVIDLILVLGFYFRNTVIFLLGFVHGYMIRFQLFWNPWLLVVKPVNQTNISLWRWILWFFRVIYLEHGFLLPQKSSLRLERKLRRFLSGFVITIDIRVRTLFAKSKSSLISLGICRQQVERVGNTIVKMLLLVESPRIHPLFWIVLWMD